MASNAPRGLEYGLAAGQMSAYLSVPMRLSPVSTLMRNLPALRCSAGRRQPQLRLDDASGRCLPSPLGEDQLKTTVVLVAMFGLGFFTVLASIQSK